MPPQQALDVRICHIELESDDNGNMEGYLGTWYPPDAMLRIPVHLTCTAALGGGVMIALPIFQKRKLRLRKIRTLV